MAYKATDNANNNIADKAYPTAFEYYTAEPAGNSAEN